MDAGNSGGTESEEDDGRAIVARVRITRASEKFCFRVSLLLYSAQEVGRLFFQSRKEAWGDPVEISGVERVAADEVAFDIKRKHFHHGDAFRFSGDGMHDSAEYGSGEVIGRIEEDGIFDSCCACGG